MTLSRENKSLKDRSNNNLKIDNKLNYYVETFFKM